LLYSRISNISNSIGAEGAKEISTAIKELKLLRNPEFTWE
jgi:hypothetical protein